MKKAIKKIPDFVFNVKNERLILIGLPCVSICIAALVLIPILSGFKTGYIENTSTSNVVSTPNIYLQREESATEQIFTSPEVTPETINDNIEEIPIHLYATSTEKDLYIFIRDVNNNPVSGEIFKVIVTYPGGQIGSYNSQADGSCYLINLNAGLYTVSLEKKNGYSDTEPFTCEVYDRISYTFIQDIEEIVEITDESQIIEEVKTNDSEAPQITVAEVINTSENEQSTLFDSNGNVIYTYEWQEDAEGHLLDSNGEPTDVYPYYEEDGKLLWGFRLDGNSTLEEVTLINSDNTPVEGYSIQAIPVTSSNSGGWRNINNIISYVLPDGTLATGLKNIDGRIYYFDVNGRKAQYVGIDVSFYNGTINWSTVKNSGVDFVIIRLGGRGWGTGALYDDSCFYNYINGAKAAGLKVGVYFYSAATNRVEAVQEASIVLDRLNGTHLDMPIYIDMEYSNEYPSGRADRLSRAERVEICTAFCETIKSANYTAGLYCSQSFLSEGIDYSSISNYKIWMASYTEENRLPNTNYRYDTWQISDRGRIPGINGNCDINVIF